MPFYDDTVAAIQAKLKEMTGSRPVMAVLFGKDPAGEPIALSLDAAGVLAAMAIPPLWTAVTASDATDLTTLATKGLLVGGAGNIAVRTVGAPSTTVTYACVAGQYLPGQFTRVMAATTATGIVALS